MRFVMIVTHQDLFEMYQMRRLGSSLKEIANKFHISISTASIYCRGIANMDEADNPKKLARALDALCKAGRTKEIRDRAKKL